MWAKLDDKLRCHPKVVAAGKRVGGQFGRVRAYGTFVEVISYCAEYLTSGLFPEASVEELSDPQARRVIGALCAVGLMEPHALGWQVHDWEDHNPDAEAEKDKRAHWARQKREQRAKKRGLQPELANLFTVDSPVDMSTGQSADMSGGHSTDNGGQSASCPVDCPSRDRARVPVPSRPVPIQKPQEQRSAHRVLTKLAHTVLDDLETGVTADGVPLTPADVPEELKLRAARARLPYDATALGKARDAADVQRRRARR